MPRAVAMPRQARPTVKRRDGAKPRKRPPDGLDAYHLIAAIGGTFTGVVLFSLLSMGRLGNDKDLMRAHPRNDLSVVQVQGDREPDGRFRVRGQIVNGGEKACRLASVTIRFFNPGGKVIKRSLAVAENIRGGSKKPFEAHMEVDGATRYEVALDLAQF